LYKHNDKQCGYNGGTGLKYNLYETGKKNSAKEVFSKGMFVSRKAKYCEINSNLLFPNSRLHDV
jgi:hypothetical protein